MRIPKDIEICYLHTSQECEFMNVVGVIIAGV